MSNLLSWQRRVNDFFGDLDCAQLTDEEYMELMEEIEIKAQDAASAKREEMEKEPKETES